MSAAYLLLEDGTRFDGEGAGAITTALGEAVFTTGMTGYQETLTDPSFNGQIITFSAPMIGNYGIESDVGESDRVQAIGMVCREARNAQPPGRTGLLDWLADNGVPVLFGIDTRALVQHLRDHGAQRSALVTDGTTPEEAQKLIASTPEMAGQDLAAGVSRPRREQDPADGATRCTVALLDYGAKDSIGDLVAEAGAHVVIVPHDATAADIAAINPDGILLANGPGDPGAMDAHVANVQAMLELGVPVFGIAYKDKPEDSLRFLRERGNPYRRLSRDEPGRVAIDWGVYGVPETYLLDRQGIIRWRYAGPITQDVLDQDIRPLLRRFAA